MMKVHLLYHCDERGGAESRGSGYKQHTCHSPVSSPTRSSRMIKGGITTVQNERGPGLYYLCCAFVFVLCGRLHWPLPWLSAASQLITTTYYTQLYFQWMITCVFLTQRYVTDLEVLKYSLKVVGTVFLVLYCPLWLLTATSHCLL